MTGFVLKYVALAVGLGTCFFQNNVLAAEECATLVQPVVNIDLPSRYKDDDKSRSEIDEKLNAEVEKSLAPIDGFIRNLADAANKTLDEKKASAAAECIFRSLASWAQAGALTQAETMNAHLALSSRIAGISAAYARALTVEKPSATNEKSIQDWLVTLTEKQIVYFDTKAPPMASRNNHRAWAGLAAAQVGAITGRQNLMDWGAQTNQMLICSAGQNGSLPEEMKRKDKALHYQLHAVAPIVMTARILYPSRPDSLSVCDGKLDTIVDFTISALANPEIVADIAGTKQSFQTRKEKLKAFQIAWLEPYLFLQNDDVALSLAKSYRPLANSFLGGNLTRYYENAD
jgi:poly(beta-D-mannuronate) lyase